MALDLSPHAFYESARSFAGTAMRAHHARDHRRVALDAGTALEHLLKACLASRSPALLVELKPSDVNYYSLLRLLKIPEGGPLSRVRTVSLRDALQRMKAFVTPSVSEEDLQTLVGMRDGTVHAALSDEVETHLLAVFAQFANTLLDDLGQFHLGLRDRAQFWGDQQPVIDALLADASDMVAHDVEVKLAAARAYFAREYGEGPVGLLELARQRFEPDEDPGEDLGFQMAGKCPVCNSLAVASGVHDVEWEPEHDEDQTDNANPTVWFTPSTFECRICRLRLDSLAEIIAAGMKPRWEHESADFRKYEMFAIFREDSNNKLLLC
jgi:hypothetical protein